MANRIHSKGTFRAEEIVAGAAGIYPGMLLTRGASGVVVHATEGGRHEKMFALEDALQGQTVDDVYTSGEIVFLILPNLGSEVYALLEDGQNVVVGTELISAGNGKLKAVADLESGETLSQVVGVAAEAKDLTGSNTEDTLIRVCIVG